jgi:hypothetical protein
MDMKIQSLLVVVSCCIATNLVGAEAEKPPIYSNAPVASAPVMQSNGSSPSHDAALALLKHAYDSGQNTGDTGGTGPNIKGNCNVVCVWPSCPISVNITPILHGIKLALLNCFAPEEPGKSADSTQTDDIYKNTGMFP